MDAEQRDVRPKDKPPEIERDPIAAATSKERQIQEVDGSRQ